MADKRQTLIPCMREGIIQWSFRVTTAVREGGGQKGGGNSSPPILIRYGIIFFLVMIDINLLVRS